jgi:hypothetical protein
VSGYDQRLQGSVARCGPDAVTAAIALMERHDPDSLEQALDLVSGAGDSGRCREIVAEAWDPLLPHQGHAVELSLGF